jgi:hypothetical protein
MDHVGIDVHKGASWICMIAEGGELIERRVRTEVSRLAEALEDRVRARILIEASTESEWVARCLERLGDEMIVADPNFAPMYATRHRKVKPGSVWATYRSSAAPDMAVDEVREQRFGHGPRRCAGRRRPSGAPGSRPAARSS